MKLKNLIFAVMLLCVFSTLAAAQNEDRINAALDEAARLYNAADYKNAAVKYEEVLSLDRNRPSTHYNAAACYEVLGDKAKAAAHLREYLKLSPNAEDRKEVENWISSLEPKGGKKAASGAPLVTPPSAWVIKAGAFMCGNQCAPEEVDIDPGWMVGVEYWDPLKKRNVVVYGLFYSRSEYEWTTFNVGGEMDYLQLSASYLWKAGGGRADALDGLYYGLGLGYGTFNFNGVFDDGDGTLDVNGILGYNFANSIAAEGIWIIDENSGVLSLGYRF